MRVRQTSTEAAPPSSNSSTLSSILWEQTPEPFKAAKSDGPKKAGAEKEIKDLDGLIAKVVRPMKKTDIVNLAIEGGHGSYYLARKLWSQIEARLVENEKGLFKKAQIDPK